MLKRPLAEKKAADQGARILIVTDYDDEAPRRAAMRAGACGYVLKYNLLALVQLLDGASPSRAEDRIHGALMP